MIQASFYLLSNETQYDLYICRLVEKIYRMNMRIYLLTSKREEAVQLDQILWDFRPDSFIPHEIYDKDQETLAPVIIGDDIKISPPRLDILLNLHPEIPAFYTQFSRIIEVVGTEPQLKQQSREKYKHYQKSGVQLTTHHI